MSTITNPKRSVAVPAHPEAPISRRFAGLDGLRAVAVITVIAFHFVPAVLPGGYLGVDVFFVISGFLITALLLRERANRGRISVPVFWLRRVRRLIPALALVVVVCSAVAALIGGDVLVGLASQLVGAATFSSNWIFIVQGASYFDATTPELFRNLWSLAVEEQFYLVWPALLLALLLVRWKWVQVVIVAVVAVASAVAMALMFTPPGDATRVYYGTDTHSFGLALGAALAIAVTRMPARWPTRTLALLGALAVGALIVLALTMGETDPLVTRGGLFLVAALTALAIAGSLGSDSWLGRGLDIPPLRWIGERSYGLYLWHWPVIVLFAAALPVDAPWWIAPSCALVVTVAAAAASYRWVELPVRRLGFRGAVASLTGRPRRAVAASLGGVLAAAVLLTGATIAVDPAPKSQAQLAIEQGEQALADAAAARPLRPGPGRPIPLPSGDQIYAVGDSVMLAAAPWLQEQFPGIAIDAAVSRSMWTAPDIVGSAVAAGAMRPILLIGLGTNGPVDPADLAAVLAIVPKDTQIVLVNAQAPKDWIPGVNATLAEFARTERSVELANWHAAIAPRIDELARDQVHPGGPISSGIYIGSISDALQRLAELPPLLGNNDYQNLNRPM